MGLKLVGLCGLKIGQVDRLRFVELLLALQCHLRVGQLRLRGIEISLRFLQRCLIGRGIDLSYQVALLNHCPFLDCITKKDAFDLRLQGDVGNRHNVAKRVDRQRHALGRGHGKRYRLKRSLRRRLLCAGGKTDHEQPKSERELAFHSWPW